MNNIIERLKKIKIVSIIRLNSVDKIEQVVEALYKGNIRAIEITMNTPDAIEGIKKVKSMYPDLLIGAGTVLYPDTVYELSKIGIDFILTPTLNKKTIETALQKKIPIIPGAFSPTEILHAFEYGASIVKVFPARQVGPSYFMDLKGPLPKITKMAVGGISLENANEFLKSDAHLLGIGSSLVDEKLVFSEDFAEIERRARAFTDIIKDS